MIQRAAIPVATLLVAIAALASGVACGGDPKKPANDSTSVTIVAPDGGEATQVK